MKQWNTPTRCSFCTIPDFFKGGIRYRPVEDAVEEIRNSGAKCVELHADNLLVNRNIPCSDPSEYSLDWIDEH